MMNCFKKSPRESVRRRGAGSPLSNFEAVSYWLPLLVPAHIPTIWYSSYSRESPTLRATSTNLNEFVF